MPDQPKPVQHKPRFLAPLGKRCDYVDHPSLGVHGEPECVGPAILENYAELNRRIKTQQTLLEVAEAQVERPRFTAQQRHDTLHARAKHAHVDISHELHIVQREIVKARLRGRPVKDAALVRLEGLEALLDGVSIRSLAA